MPASSGLPQLVRRPRRSTRRTRILRIKRFLVILALVLIITGIAFTIWYFWSQTETPESEISDASAIEHHTGDVTNPEVTAGVIAYVYEGIPLDLTQAAIEEDDATPQEPIIYPSYLTAQRDIVPEALGDSASLIEDPFFDDAFFIGDSITTGLLRHEAFDDRPILAEVGLTLASVLDKLEAFKQAAPKRIFILLGANDLTYYNMSDELFTERYLNLVKALQEDHPEAIIYLQSILPVTSDYNGNELLTNERISTTNAALKKFAEAEKLPFIDIGCAWRLEDNTLHPEVSDSDGLHISYHYYGSWLTILKDWALFWDAHPGLY